MTSSAGSYANKSRSSTNNSFRDQRSTNRPQNQHLSRDQNNISENADENSDDDDFDSDEVDLFHGDILELVGESFEVFFVLHCNFLYKFIRLPLHVSDAHCNAHVYCKVDKKGCAKGSPRLHPQ